VVSYIIKNLSVKIEISIQKYPRTDLVKPVKLPRSEESVDFYLNRYLKLASWGFHSSTGNSYSDTLRLALMEISTIEECSQQIPRSFLSENVICSRDSHCSGDSGSMLIDIDSDENFIAVGIASFGLGSCQENQRKHSVFMRISRYKEWIKNNIS
jgi:secreted trypsin-like serine protease